MMNTLHILTQQDSKFMGGVGQEFTLEQIAVEGVGQNISKQIGGSCSRVHGATVLMCFLHS